MRAGGRDRLKVIDAAVDEAHGRPSTDGAQTTEEDCASVNTTSDVRGTRVPHARMLMVAVTVALSLVAVPGQAVAGPASDASYSVDLVNETRWAHGLAQLTPDRELQTIANRQAHRMAESGSIFHTRNLGGQLSWGWWAWSENVGYGPSVAWLHDAFMNSWYHSSNILDPSYNYVGVGVAYGADGKVYVAQVFGAW